MQAGDHQNEQLRSPSRQALAQEDDLPVNDHTKQDGDQEPHEREVEGQDNPPEGWLDQNDWPDNYDVPDMNVPASPRPNPYYNPEYNDTQNQDCPQDNSDEPDFWNMPEEQIEDAAAFLTMHELENRITDFVNCISADRSYEETLRRRINWGQASRTEPAPGPVPAGRGRGRGQTPILVTQSPFDEHTDLIAKIIENTRRMRTLARVYDDLDAQSFAGIPVEIVGILENLAFDFDWNPEPRLRTFNTNIFNDFDIEDVYDDEENDIGNESRDFTRVAEDEDFYEGSSAATLEKQQAVTGSIESSYMREAVEHLDRLAITAGTESTEDKNRHEDDSHSTIGNTTCSSNMPVAEQTIDSDSPEQEKIELQGILESINIEGEQTQQLICEHPTSSPDDIPSPFHFDHITETQPLLDSHDDSSPQPSRVRKGKARANDY